MTRSIAASSAVLALTLMLTGTALCTDLVGTVADGQGQAVQGARVIALTSDGATTFTTNTNADGQYQIGGLSPGQYFITLEAASIGSHTQTVVSYLGHSGLTVNWSVAPGTTPIAVAQPGIELTSASSVNSSGAAVLAASDRPPGCKVKGGTSRSPGPPCGPKSKKRHGD